MALWSPELLARCQRNTERVLRMLPSDQPDEFVQAGGGGLSLVRYRVIEVENDVLLCDRLSVGEEPADVLTPVAKPAMLRHDESYYPGIDELTTIDAQRVRVSAVGYESETWAVTPLYLDNASGAASPYVWAIAVETGLEWESLPVLRLDINSDGRAWAWTI